MDEPKTEVIEKNNFEKVEDYIKNSKIKRFILDPLSLYASSIRIYYQALYLKEYGISQLRYYDTKSKAMILGNLFSMNNFVKRILGSKKEAGAQRVFDTGHFLYSIYRLQFLINTFKYFRKDNIDSILGVLWHLNNLSEVYLGAMNISRAIKR